MPGERLLRILERLSPSDAQPSTARLCEVARDVASMTGAGIMLMSGDVPRVAVLEQRRERAAGGPAVHTGRGAVRRRVQPRPAGARSRPRRPRDPALARLFAARRGGRRSCRVRVSRTGRCGADSGSLNLYRDRPGALTHDQYADSLVMADVAARAVIAMQADAPPGSIPDAIESAPTFASSCTKPRAWCRCNSA